MNPTQTHPNATAAALTGLGTTLLLYLLHLAGIDVPREIAAAIVTAVVTVALAAAGPKRT